MFDFHHRQRIPSSAARLAVFLLFSALWTVTQSAYIVSIPAKDEECYYIVTPPGSTYGATLHGNFDLLDDSVSPDPLSVIVLDYEQEHVLFRSRRRAREGIFQVSLKPDQHVYLCLQNGLVTASGGRKATPERNHDGQVRTVGFQFTVQAKNAAQELMTQNERMIQSTEDLAREIGNLKNHHEFMRTREAKHREVVEQTFSQLMRWLLLEVSTVIFIAGAQIMYFRRFLERRRYI
ncbi:emp24/gp25L/p24 family protein [Nitzschia inconspicua]|uniref:Emp24/gp25L/p24 family protein n=1 Tax=Nitzschia inconspicua TaxID=303405 RepID=A0A9K3KII9_9STRA|nr:emp24/gp25L/p24 family protein [Nitzschia inconspicua]